VIDLREVVFVLREVQEKRSEMEQLVAESLEVGPEELPEAVLGEQQTDKMEVLVVGRVIALACTGFVVVDERELLLQASMH